MLGENAESLKDLLETFYEDVTFESFEAAFKGEAEPADAEGMFMLGACQVTAGLLFLALKHLKRFW